MSVRNTDKGWMWGDKGPFGTKEQALAASRGMPTATKEAEAMATINLEACAEFVGTLLHSATVAHFMHLQVEGAGADAAHRALGDYYDSIVDAVDSVAENIQGAHDVIIQPYPAMLATPDMEPLAYMRKLREYVRTARNTLPQDSEIRNEVDAVATLINRTCYRLQRLK